MFWEEINKLFLFILITMVIRYSFKFADMLNNWILNLIVSLIGYIFINIMFNGWYDKRFKSQD